MPATYTIPNVMTPSQLREYFRLAAPTDAPAHEVDDLADQFAAEIVALRRGGVVGSRQGAVRRDPDPRFLDKPFVPADPDDGGWPRYGRRELGEIFIPSEDRDR